MWSLLDSGSPEFSNLLERIGAVGRSKPGASQPQIESELVDLTQNAGYLFPASLLAVTSGSSEVHRYLEFYLIFVLLAVTSAVLIVYARSGAGLSRAPLRTRDRWYWWSFLVAKSGLLLITAGLMAWMIVRYVSVHMLGSVLPLTNGIALWLFLALSVAPLSVGHSRSAKALPGVPAAVGNAGSHRLSGPRAAGLVGH